MQPSWNRARGNLVRREAYKGRSEKREVKSGEEGKNIVTTQVCRIKTEGWHS